jgi:hypothetical protein
MELSERSKSNWQRLYAMSFASIYPQYLKKTLAKGRTAAELDQIIRWLTGYTAAQLKKATTGTISLEDFFGKAKLNPKAKLITGTICGMKIAEITEPLMRQIRWLDKLVDELAQGKPMEKILRA